MSNGPISSLRRSTIAVAAGRPAVVPGDPLNTGISLSATFHAGTEANYLRQGGSEIARAFETALGELEGGRALGFSSGMAAAAAVIAAQQEEQLQAALLSHRPATVETVSGRVLGKSQERLQGPWSRLGVRIEQ